MILREPIWCIWVDLRNLSLLKIWEQRKMNNTNLSKEIQVFRLKLSLWRDWMLEAESSSIAWIFWLKKKRFWGISELSGGNKATVLIWITGFEDQLCSSFCRLFLESTLEVVWIAKYSSFERRQSESLNS